MFGTTGFAEVLVILAVALLVLGPSRLLTVLRYASLILRKGRILYLRVADEVERQMRLDEMLKNNIRPAAPTKKTRNQRKKKKVDK